MAKLRGDEAISSDAGIRQALIASPILRDASMLSPRRMR
jgi:hypothetical protein